MLVSLDRISTGTGLNPGGQPSNRQRDRIGKTRSQFVRQRDRVDPVRLAVNVTGSIIADRGITGDNAVITGIGAVLSPFQTCTPNEMRKLQLQDEAIGSCSLPRSAQSQDTACRHIEVMEPGKSHLDAALGLSQHPKRSSLEKMHR